MELNRDVLVDLAGWSVLKEARVLHEAGRVKHFEWQDKLLKGEVAGAGTSFFPRLNLRSLTFAENRCNCATGRRGSVCAHAIALCLASMETPTQAEPTEMTAQASEGGEGSTPKPHSVQSLVLSESKGIPARFRILLPPNLARAAPQDRIAVRIEFELASGVTCLLQQIDRGKAYQLAVWDQALAGMVESLCGGKLHSMLQLTRTQLRDLLSCVAGQPVVAWLKEREQAIPWKGDELDGVHLHLRDPSEAGSESRVQHGPGMQSAVAPSTASGNARRADRLNRSAAGLQRVQVDGSPHFLAVTLPSREDPSYSEIHALLQAWRFRLEPSNGKWWLRDRHHVLNFLAEHWERFRTAFQAQFSSNFSERLRNVRFLEMTAEVIELGNGVELRITASEGISEASLRQQLARGRCYLESDANVWLLQPERLKQLELLVKRLTGDPAAESIIGFAVRGGNSDACDWQALLEDSGLNYAAPEQWTSRSAAIRNLSKLEEAPVPGQLYDRLRLYQKIGVAWMHHLYRHQLGGILADEMGLGKTIQAIALLSVIASQESAAPALVVCPAGLVGNWMRELRQFAPWLRTACHHGAARSATTDGWTAPYDVVVTSYSTLAIDRAGFAGVNWSIVIGDEAQHIKNRRTQHARSLKQLRCDGRFLLTGTPIENSVDDLFSLFEFLMPGYLNSTANPRGKSADRQWHMERMRERCAHYILRRTKTQVAPELPEKLEQVLYCDMEPEQRSLYDRIRKSSSQTLDRLQMGGVSQGQLKMAAFTELLRLRQVCADPRLVDASLDASMSCKLAAFRELLQESIDGGHRMLVFSQFVSALQLLKQELEQLDLPYAYIDGITRDRLAEADRFNADSRIPVFLISLKAGGTGLNLTGADVVVHFDPWWNPAVEAQATDRAHRIGQTRTVTAIRLIVSGTVEEKVQLMQQEKRGLLDALFDESASLSARLRFEDIQSLFED